MIFALRYLFLLVVVILLSGIEFCRGQLLTVEYSAVKLSSPNDCPRPFYDGNDRIYILGGYPAWGDEILVYSLSSDTIERLGSMPGIGYFGSVQGDNFGNIFFIGGGDNCRAVYKFDPDGNVTTVVATLPTDAVSHTSIKFNDTSNTVYILGGGNRQNKDVLAFDLQSFNYSIVTSVEYSVSGGTSVRVENKAYVFAYEGEGAALEFDLNTLQMRRVGPSSLPWFSWYPSSVADENFAYIIGGYHPSNGSAGGVIQFDTKSFENTFLPVRNFPVEGLSYFYYAPGSVFVASLNRIYCFGGLSFNTTTNQYKGHDEIFYIDLTQLDPLTPTPTTTTENTPSTTTGEPTSSTLNPDFFSCSNRTTGLYPHPTDCTMFIGCLDDEMTFFQCPPPLLFDAILTVCHYPDQVECGISCVDKPDGDYPHPHDCSLYIICRSGVPNVFKCPHPLLFDPIQRFCYFPHLVTCSDIA